MGAIGWPVRSVDTGTNPAHGPMKLYPPEDTCEPAGLEQSRVPRVPDDVFPATIVPARFMVAML